MKSKHIVLLGLALSWALTSCVFEDELVLQEAPPAPAVAEQAAADAAETAVEKMDTALAESPASTASSTTSSTVSSRATLPGQYVIQPGDTFRAISARAGIYWNETLWTGIYNANRDKIANPDVIRPGTVLVIPPLRGEIREGLWEASRYYENPFVAGASSSAAIAPTNTAPPVAAGVPSGATATAPTNTAPPVAAGVPSGAIATAPTNTAPPVAAGATNTTARASENVWQTQIPTTTIAPTSNTAVRRNIVSCRIAGVERADQLSYVTLDWTGLNSVEGTGMNVKIEVYSTNRTLVGTIVLENSHGYGRWNRYLSVTGEFLTAYNSWNDRIDFASIENNAIQLEHLSTGNVFIRIALDGTSFPN
jgi:LysM repeat protein